jgi:hypothetical protein
MRKLLQKYQFQFYLVIIGIFWLLLINFFLQIFQQNYIYADTESYIRASKDFYFSHKPNEIRPSLIAAINGLPFLFGFTKSSLFLWNTILNLILWLATLLLIYSFCSKIVNPKKAFYIALVYVFTLGSLLVVFEFLSEPLFSFSLLVPLILFQKYDNTKKIGFLSIGLSMLIISMLIKPASLLLFFVVCFLFGFKVLVKVLQNKSSIAIYISIIIVFAHLQSMKTNYGNYTLSYIDSFTYYNYLGTKSDCLKNNKEFLQCNNYRYNYFNKFSLPEGKKIAFEDFKNQLTHNTINFMSAYFSNLVGNSCKASGYFYAYENKKSSNNFEVYKIIFRGISRIQCLLYSLIGILLSIYYIFKKKTNKIIKITSFSIVYIIVISAISSDQGDRFHIVVYPLILILVAKFLSKKTKLFSEPLQK